MKTRKARRYLECKISAKPTKRFLEPIGFWNLYAKSCLSSTSLYASGTKAHFSPSTQKHNREKSSLYYQEEETSNLTSDSPAILPKLAPAEIMPKSLLLESHLNTSASKLHTLEITKEIKHQQPPYKTHSKAK